MIRSVAIPGVAFGSASDGDGRRDAAVRMKMSEGVGAPTCWATISQVHGDVVRKASNAEHLGEADGLVTTRPGLSLAVATADCLPIALAGSRTVALVHAGWRGIVAGVIPAAIATMDEMGDEPAVAAIGPHIGACCYEVGDEVIEALGGYEATTRWNTQSADLAGAACSQLDGIETEVSAVCTMDDHRFNSFRRDGTSKRQVTVAWLPSV